MKLALFFTRNMSLKFWVDAGLFDREKQLYEEHLRIGLLQKVFWLTYGKDDAELAKELKCQGRLAPDIEVLAMPHCFFGKWGCLVYSFLMPLFCRRWLKDADVLKTNQMDGSWSAVIARWLYKKPLIVRTGYTASFFVQRQSKSKIKKRIYESMERFAYHYASIAVVASYHDERYIHSKYFIPHRKIKVLHNYVDTAIFCPFDCEKYADRIIFVGRLIAEKNLLNLIRALPDTDLALDVYGKGEVLDGLKALAKRLDAKVNFAGVVPNCRLPDVLNRYRYYILPSLYEGMPKALLEAMACGLVCIGSDVEGINEVIEDGVNGYLAKGTQPEALAEVMNRVTRLPSDRIVAEAIQTVRNSFSLETIAEREKKIIMALKG